LYHEDAVFYFHGNIFGVMSVKKIFFNLFAITETTDKGRRWKRVTVGAKDARWTKLVKLTEAKLKPAMA